MDPEEGPDAQLERVELRKLLARALMELPERERQILALYYEEEMTMAEIGEVIGVCESRVSQLRSLAISRLRTSMKTMIASPEMRDTAGVPA
jgi:RNA polymerase sigma factor for flagellar operon FliA